jgi:hypothetical protein
MRKLTVVLCLALAGVTVGGCGGSPPSTFCKDYANLVCRRSFECYDAATQATQAFVDMYGASEAECDSKLSASFCATLTDAKPCQDSSMSYHSDKADACINDTRAASCQTITGGSFSSDNCDKICS